jgi:hypothetical protein
MPSSPRTKLNEGKRAAYSAALRSSAASPGSTLRTPTSAHPHAANSAASSSKVSSIASAIFGPS